MKNDDCITAFGDHLKVLRKKHKLSQQKLANLADIDKKTIQRIETKQFNPSLDILASIATGFGISLKELVDFTYAKRKI